jgi:hypothetical protein
VIGIATLYHNLGVFVDCGEIAVWWFIQQRMLGDESKKEDENESRRIYPLHIRLYQFQWIKRMN